MSPIFHLIVDIQTIVLNYSIRISFNNKQTAECILTTNYQIAEKQPPTNNCFIHLCIKLELVNNSRTNESYLSPTNSHAKI